MCAAVSMVSVLMAVASLHLHGLLHHHHRLCLCLHLLHGVHLRHSCGGHLHGLHGDLLHSLHGNRLALSFVLRFRARFLDSTALLVNLLLQGTELFVDHLESFLSDTLVSKFALVFFKLMLLLFLNVFDLLLVVLDVVFVVLNFLLELMEFFHNVFDVKAFKALERVSDLL